MSDEEYLEHRREPEIAPITGEMLTQDVFSTEPLLFFPELPVRSDPMVRAFKPFNTDASRLVTVVHESRMVHNRSWPECTSFKRHNLGDDPILIRSVSTDAFTGTQQRRYDEMISRPLGEELYSSQYFKPCQQRFGPRNLHEREFKGENLESRIQAERDMATVRRFHSAKSGFSAEIAKAELDAQLSVMARRDKQESEKLLYNLQEQVKKLFVGGIGATDFASCEEGRLTVVSEDMDRKKWDQQSQCSFLAADQWNFPIRSEEMAEPNIPGSRVFKATTAVSTNTGRASFDSGRVSESGDTAQSHFPLFISSASSIKQDDIRPRSKPPYSYPMMISQAILDSPTGMLTQSEIHASLGRMYPNFYGPDGCFSRSDSWKNTVRFYLSQSQLFEQCKKISHGFPGAELGTGDVATSSSAAVLPIIPRGPGRRQAYWRIVEEWRTRIYNEGIQIIEEIGSDRKSRPKKAAK